MRILSALSLIVLLATPAAAQWKTCVLKSWAHFLAPGLQSYRLVETFQSGRGLVSAIRFGPLAGETAKLYMFLLGNLACGKAAVVIGSYEMTTRAARQAGDIGPDDRLYHADLYEIDRHATLGFFTEPPDYEAARGIALKALAGP